MKAKDQDIEFSDIHQGRLKTLEIYMPLNDSSWGQLKTNKEFIKKAKDQDIIVGTMLDT